ncbi:MAG: hypothetical protein KO464_06570 [Candidatus Methanofastidiosum sp.]|nr:hypothetical protein [Methanofastidiosum sp.]
MPDKLVPITKENIDKVLEFLPYFQNRSNIFYKEGLEHEYPIKVYDFLRTLYEQKFTVEFPSYKRRKDIYSFVDRIIPMSEANIGDIASIFKIILAGDRLTMGGGYLEDCIDNGLVLDLLKRLKEIRDKMD